MTLRRRAFDATFGRAMAAVYDRALARSERKGLSALRTGLLRRAAGRTLELGAGTGLNLEHYPAEVELVAIEPFEPMARQLRERAAGSGRKVEVVEAEAERLPFPDNSFDTVTGTLVLCTVTDPDRALAEVRRVLRPNGRFLFLEHVRSGDPRRARWQDRFEKPWYVIGHGCHCNRDTLASIEAAGLAVEELDETKLPAAVPIVEPLIVGAAAAPA